MYVYVLHVCLCTTCMPGVQRDQKVPNSHMELELEMVVSSHVGAEPRSSRRMANDSTTKPSLQSKLTRFSSKESSVC